ncbi:MAG: fatty acid desaturase [Planctomycetota bacterium]
MADQIGHRTPAPRARVAAEKPVHYGPLPLGLRILNLVLILAPLCAFVWAVAYAWGAGIGWVELAVGFVFYLATGFGVTIGYHRLLTHKSFRTGRVMTAILGILGSMATEGPILNWVAFHRCHHQHSDHEHDPHSPHGHGSGVWGTIKGFWMAHCGWVLSPRRKDLGRYVVDLEKDPLVRWISRLFPVWALLSLALPALAVGLFTMSWWGALMGFVWGGLIRVAMVHHITWSVNSICHLWGNRPFESHDESRNNAIVGVLALGEGWHNNHHAFPTSARHGLKWWQFDSSWIVIRVLERVGLVWDVKVPSPERMRAKAA